MLNEHPEITLVEIQGHTAADGQVTYGRSPSFDRADSVRKALIAKGVEPARLTAKGYGDSVPLVPNDTEENKRVNWRVEVRILQRGPS
ncbi:MAG: OmpA family protein [Polyangiaceae bacterium]|nr:OmpA family protein [Polyangiaceae bacterium]